MQPDNGSEVVFLHIKAFRRGQRRPVGGESVVYELSFDATKRPRAERVEMKDSPVGISADRALMLMAAGFFAAVTGTAWFGAIPAWVAWTYGVASIVTAFVYVTDKLNATQRAWRTSEATLHLLEAIGGWPGGLIAQRMFQHKTKKQAYQVVFWLIVFAHLGLWVWLIVGRKIDLLRGKI